MLSLAMERVKVALTLPNGPLFYPNIFQAFQLFVKCDAYIIFQELLLGKKKSLDPQQKETIARISSAFNLLDAHVYAKIGDIEQ